MGMAGILNNHEDLLEKGELIEGVPSSPARDPTTLPGEHLAAASAGDHVSELQYLNYLGNTHFLT